MCVQKKTPLLFLRHLPDRLLHTDRLLHNSKGVFMRKAISSLELPA